MTQVLSYMDHDAKTMILILKSDSSVPLVQPHAHLQMLEFTLYMPDLNTRSKAKRTASSCISVTLRLAVDIEAPWHPSARSGTCTRKRKAGVPIWAAPASPTCDRHAHGLAVDNLACCSLNAG